MTFADLIDIFAGPGALIPLIVFLVILWVILRKSEKFKALIGLGKFAIVSLLVVAIVYLPNRAR